MAATSNSSVSDFQKYILVTGGSGFIGSHLVIYLVKKYPQYCIVNVDKLTYAANSTNLQEIEEYPNYAFYKIDIVAQALIKELFEKYPFDCVLHLAAESHVDRSISQPFPFIETNIKGTVSLLETVRDFWNSDENKLFFHISTDEVYGSCSAGGFSEKAIYAPSSPYAASKASSDHFVQAFYKTYQIPYLISHCTNNYGANQYPEKLIPLAINRMYHKKSVPIYGQGRQIRNWLFVQDHVEALDFLLHSDIKNTTYNIGSKEEKENIELLAQIADLVDQELGQPQGTSQQLFKFVKDRLGHDFRYALNTKKIRQLGWQPRTSLEKGLRHTVKWYLSQLQKIVLNETRS